MTLHIRFACWSAYALRKLLKFVGGVGAGELERPLSPLLAIFLPVLQKVLWRIDGQGGG